MGINLKYTENGGSRTFDGSKWSSGALFRGFAGGFVGRFRLGQAWLALAFLYRVGERICLRLTGQSLGRRDLSSLVSRGQTGDQRTPDR